MDPTKWLETLNRLGGNTQGLLKGVVILGGLVFSPTTALIMTSWRYPEFFNYQSLQSPYNSLIAGTSIASGALVAFAFLCLLIFWISGKIRGVLNSPERIFKKLSFGEQCVLSTFFIGGITRQHLMDDNFHVVALKNKDIIRFQTVVRGRLGSIFSINERYWLGLKDHVPDFLTYHVESEELRSAIKMVERASASDGTTWMSR